MYKIVKKETLNSVVELMEIHAPFVARKCEPGQFIILRVDEDGERVPLTIADYDREKGTVTIIFQKVGLSTKLLAAKEIGDTIQDFVGPLGVATEYDGMKKVAVVGGGDAALEDAIFLARMCEKVYIVHRRDKLRGAKRLQERLQALENIEFVWNSETVAIEGNAQVEALRLRQTKTGEERRLDVDGVFIAVGIAPESELYAGQLELDEQGYIRADESGQTSVPGVFAAGDVRTKALRQILTAASDGANCVASAERYLQA